MFKFGAQQTKSDPDKKQRRWIYNSFKVKSTKYEVSG